MKIKKLFSRILLTGTLVILSTTSVYGAGWTNDDRGQRYQKEDGSYVISDWLEHNQIWYHFNAEGYWETGWIWADGYWWYQNTDGSYACNGSQVIDGKIYSFDENGHLKQASEHEQKIQHIRDVYNQTNTRTDLKAYDGGNYIDYAVDDDRLVKAILKNDFYLTLPTVEYYYEWVWKDGYYSVDLIFAYGTDGTREYRYYYQNHNLIREIGPDGVVRDYPDGDGLRKTSDTQAESILSRGWWETALFMEGFETEF